jgi:hypothetical protein
MSIFLAMIAALTGCEDRGLCYYNCPDDPRLICGHQEMGPDEKAKCQTLANRKCVENPEALDEWDGGVVFQLIECEDVCGVPTWCLND